MMTHDERRLTAGPSSVGDRMRMDIAAWIYPGRVTPADEVDLRTALPLIYRHVGLRAVLAFRVGNWFHQRGIPVLPGLTQRMIQRRYGLEIMVGADIGGGLYIAHPVGTVLVVDRMGRDCSVIAAVTVGMRNEYAFPTIGDRVFLGAGCRVLGGLTLGDDARVGANAVVVGDVEPGAVVVGVPARPVPGR